MPEPIQPAQPSPARRGDAPGGDLLAAAVEQARSAAVETAGDPELVGEHLGSAVEPEAAGEGHLGEARTHLFASALPGYVGWHWAVTVAHAAGEEQVTVDEVVLLPGEQALLAPAWVPWHERLRPGDLSVGDVLPATEDDPRLVPAYAASDDADDDDADEDPQLRAVASELGFGRERVMSREGRAEAAARWASGDFGPRAPMARQAPGPCGTCGFYLPLGGSLRWLLGACGNVYSPADGRVVTVDYGCGAHSQATLPAGEPAEVVTSARYDTADFDVL